jgi:transcriptional regulator with XRE-family HTH domain
MTTAPDEYPQHTAIADEVRVWLARRKMSAAQAALTLGWSQTYLSRRMRGDVAFDVNDLLQLAKLLRVKIQDFFPDHSESRGINGSYSLLSAFGLHKRRNVRAA